MEIGGYKFYYADEFRINVKKENKSALFQMRENYMPILLCSEMDEASTYRAMLLMERNIDMIREWYHKWVR